MVNWFVVLILFPYGVMLLGTLFFVYLKLSWNIPVTVFRFTGDRRRPSIIQTSARKYQRHGVTQLRVRGYRDPVRDFKSENYYPSPKKKFGGLALFEFEDGELTPVLPSVDENPRAVAAVEELRACGIVDFNFDTRVYHQLRLNMVDDTDKNFTLDNLARQTKQYQTAFEKFMAVLPFGVVAFTMIILLVGFILWLKEDPGNAARACVQGTKPLIERIAAGATAPPA